MINTIDNTYNIMYLNECVWGRSSDGRASALHAEGRGFDSLRLHHHNVLFIHKNSNLYLTIYKK